MRRLVTKKIIGVLLAALFLAFNYSSVVQDIARFPSELHIFEGDIQILDFGLPLQAKVRNEKEIDVLKFNGDSLKDRQTFDISRPLAIEPVNQGNVAVDFMLFGFIPVKRLTINVTSPKKLIPGGNSIGVSLYTSGALIVGTSEVTDENGITHFPAIDAGLLPGDVIEKVNGVTVKDADHLSKLVNKVKGKSVELECKRDNRIFVTRIFPVKDATDSKYRLGLWVRDSTAGVGTLTFVDPDTQYMGALGHAITDVDTGALLSVKNGKISESTIIDVKIGKKGLPGELVGNFSSNKKVLGSIIKNTAYGIYGKANQRITNPIYKNPMPIAYQYNIKPGRATILTTIDDSGIQEYEIQILKVNRQASPNPKGLVIEVTDPRLLEKTGGIVQGMSGSPIIMDGKIVGAITHVFVNDPKKGYGIFIEWMLEEVNKIIEDN
ncbi:MAG TPA: SpoIVB peptidase [Clostridiales bacterium]|nr:SpoIVB peptidase [Clostridiales bacterium]